MKNKKDPTLKKRRGKINKDFSDLQEKLGYTFTKKQLLVQSLTHSSYVYEKSGKGKRNNETLEFLGDAVLDLVVSNLLIDTYPKMDEGELTKVRATLVQENHLAYMARDLDLGRYLFLGKGEENSGGREKDSILSCAYEAVIGAIFRDGDYDTARLFVEQKFCKRLEYGRENAIVADAKSRLQEITQELYADAPTYQVDKEEGPDHDKMFTISVLFQEKVLASASAKNKKAAEQKAARRALKKFT